MTATRKTTWTLRCDHYRGSWGQKGRCENTVTVEADTLLMARQIAQREHRWNCQPNASRRDYCPEHSVSLVRVLAGMPCLDSDSPAPGQEVVCGACDPCRARKLVREWDDA